MPIFESQRKVQVIGSSLAITLPAFFVKVNEIEKGREITVYYNLNDILIASCVENSEDIIEHLTAIINKLNEKADMNLDEE